MATDVSEGEIINEASAKKPSKLFMIAGVITGTLILQAAVVFVVIKTVKSSPADVIGDEIKAQQTANHETQDEETQEVLICKLQCPHTNTSRPYIIDMTVCAIVPKHLVGGSKSEGEGKEEGEAASQGIEDEISSNIATIKDRMRTIVSSSDPGTLFLTMSEKPDYGLTTLKRQFKAVLDDVLGKGKIRDVLISEYMPTPVF
jgi:flagellar basal body-associated protein FliL